jgi:lysozyme family protein
MSLINEIINREGRKFTNRPADKGGPTKFGITQKTLAWYRKSPVSAKEVEELSEDEARAIYQELFIDKSPFNNLRPALRDMLIDWSVTSGTDDPTVAVQNLLNEHGQQIKVDGVFGPKTNAAFVSFLANWGETYAYNKLIDARVMFYAGLVVKDPSQLVFLKGWIIRSLSFRKY